MLKGEFLYYFKTELVGFPCNDFLFTVSQDLTPLGIIPLENCRVDPTTEVEKPCCFKLVPLKSKLLPFFISARDETEKRQWIYQLRCASSLYPVIFL